MKDLVNRVQGEGGQALAELALIMGFIVAVCVIAVAALGMAALVPLQNFMDGIS